MRSLPIFLLAALFLVGQPETAPADQPGDLRLVPFPKEVQLADGVFRLDRPLVLQTPAAISSQAPAILGSELQRAGLPKPKLHVVETDAKRLRLVVAENTDLPSIDLPALRDDATDEDYALAIRPDEIVCQAKADAGLFYALQTVAQLIRANRSDDAIPCLVIRDWPSLRWRCFQDDMTRGPSSTLDTLKFEADLGAHFKMNLFTYYMEYQYAFKKHPLIGPEDGSLEPADLAALVEYAKQRQVDILGNQQSFGHFSRILAHEEYADLRETPSLLCPAKEESYQLLDDLYSEVCPLLPFGMFNVCCDETWGLGEGPSKEQAEAIGVGGVYVGHIRRVHDLLKDKYDKRMMIWGDIILQHPDKLNQIPKDTIMLTWGYGPRDSFEDQIVPFAESGYEFFVCPGINNWSRILPDFGATTTNIHNFVRDGVKHGAVGMLNTAWEDDGEALNGSKWHGYAWGAECAWNASTTTPEEFNARIGAVLFGEQGDHFGQAIQLLAETHRLSGMMGMNNRRFWQDDFLPRATAKSIRASSDRLLEVVRPAIEHLQACRQEATVNEELLDYFLFGARRMERIGQRMLDGLEAVEAYRRVYDLPPEQAAPLLTKIEALVVENRDAHEVLGREFARLWLAESKPYALDWTMKRYQAAFERNDALVRRVAAAREALQAGQPMPSPDEIGLVMPEAFARRTRPHETSPEPLHAEEPWFLSKSTSRLGVVVQAGKVDRFELPVEVGIRLPDELALQPLHAFRSVDPFSHQEIPAQLDATETPGLFRLTLLLTDVIRSGTEASVYVYLGLPSEPETLAVVSTDDGPDGMKWIKNNRVRLLLGSEGGHVYRWEVKALDNRDLTMPGTTDWSGFSDMARGYRNAPLELDILAQGPALVRYRCSDGAGFEKTISLFAGTSWMEVVTSEPTGHYWEFDNPTNFASDGPTPGEYLFSNGKTGPVGSQADGVPAQVKAAGVRWGVKYNADRLALGIATPEVAANHVIAPGAGAGGVGIEGSLPANHFVTFAGLLDDEPGVTMTRLAETLDFRNQPRVVLYAIQTRD